jgi:RNA polymerase sigma-70 factor (ECF subfamily)
MHAWQFRVAVLRHHGTVYRFARSMLRDDREAEDVTQETFMRYWQYGNEVKHPREWLLTVARNACLDFLRRNGKLVRHESEEDLEARDDSDPAWRYQQHELSARLRGLVDRLPEPQRSLVVLFDLHGLDGAACARILDLNINQVKVYLHRARRRLRLGLEQS